MRLLEQTTLALEEGDGSIAVVLNRTDLEERSAYATPSTWKWSCRILPQSYDVPSSVPSRTVQRAGVKRSSKHLAPDRTIQYEVPNSPNGKVYGSQRGACRQRGMATRLPKTQKRRTGPGTPRCGYLERLARRVGGPARWRFRRDKRSETVSGFRREGGSKDSR